MASNYRIIESKWYGGFIIQKLIKPLYSDKKVWINAEVTYGVLDSETSTVYKTRREAEKKLKENHGK